MDRTLKDKVVVKTKQADTIKIITDFSDLYYSSMILADKNALVWNLYKKKSTMTYHHPLLIGIVLKVRLSCVKPSQKKRGKKSAKKHGKGEKNQDQGRIYTPALLLIKLKYEYI